MTQSSTIAAFVGVVGGLFFGPVLPIFSKFFTELIHGKSIGAILSANPPVIQDSDLYIVVVFIVLLVIWLAWNQFSPSASKEIYKKIDEYFKKNPERAEYLPWSE